jgi:hypothetical protein
LKNAAGMAGQGNAFIHAEIAMRALDFRYATTGFPMREY